MKKRKKQEPKKKDFANSPFNSLKGIKAQAVEQPPQVKAAPLSVEKRVEEDETAVFLRAVADVKRISPSQSPGKEKKTVTPVARKIDDQERRLFLRSLEKMDITFRDEMPDVEPLRPLAVNRMRQLKAGAIRIDFELDLHGLTRDEALDSLKQFVAGAFNRGQKAVLVITGKGNNSPAEPVLQNTVVSWLRESGKKMVAEFAPAPQQMGGSGALVVFLKDKNKAESKKL